MSVFVVIEIIKQLTNSARKFLGLQRDLTERMASALTKAAVV